MATAEDRNWEQALREACFPVTLKKVFVDVLDILQSGIEPLLVLMQNPTNSPSPSLPTNTN